MPDQSRRISARDYLARFDLSLRLPRSRLA